MYVLAVCFFAVFVTTLVSAPGMSAGWLWDAGNALGFCALAGMLFLSLPGGPRRDIRAHEWAGYAVVGIAALHALWFLLADGVAVELIKPGAPLSMWTGIIGLFCLALLMLLAVKPTRLNVHGQHSVFRRWHRVIALTGVGASVHHIIATGFYLHFWIQWALLTLFVLVTTISSVTGGKIIKVSRHAGGVTPSVIIAGTFLATCVFVGIRYIAS